MGETSWTPAELLTLAYYEEERDVWSGNHDTDKAWRYSDPRMIIDTDGMPM